MRLVTCILLLCACIVPAVAATNDQPLVILVSIDGGRWDYPERHGAPTLQALTREGVRMERLKPSFPSKTFPNHYTMVTGLRPESHGIIQNRFYDPVFDVWFGIGSNPAKNEGRWWSGEPIWITAKRQGLRTASLYWPGASAPIHGEHPDIWLPFDAETSPAQRVQQVLAWTALPSDQRPHFIALYFDTVDTAGHHYGPEAGETRTALHEIDAALAALCDGLRELQVWEHCSLIVTADHGMTTVPPAHAIVLDDLIDLSAVEIVYNGASGGLEPKSGVDASRIIEQLNAHPHLDAYPRDSVPERLHFSNNTRIPAIVLVPALGWRTTTRAAQERGSRYSLGDHGYDPDEADMGALFIAVGPRFPAGTTWPVASNIEIYELLCTLLAIEPAANEGDGRLVRLLDGSEH